MSCTISTSEWALIVWKHQGKTHTKKSIGQSVLCPKRIKFKAREFTERDLAYWKSYHISETLNFSVLNQYIRY
jgi:hypothetical protein